MDPSRALAIEGDQAARTAAFELLVQGDLLADPVEKERQAWVKRFSDAS
jgi:hypothetical protein